MKRVLWGLAAAAIMFSTQASAGIIGSITHDYGLGQHNPGGSDALHADHVMVSDQSSARFNDVFDFSSFAGTITSLQLTLDFAGIGNALFCTPLMGMGECWYARLQGSNSSTSLDDLFVRLEPGASPQTMTVSAASDGLFSNVFTHSVSTGAFGFWFSESTGMSDQFRLNSATLTVMGEAATSTVSEPSMLGLMGLGFGIAGWASFRRRRRCAAA